ncbi:MAG TPA: competence/damage-inducible protein A [Longimicrobiaceae bacterium]|nr:competence/damage-inducible protein A [Longimicrobiaceae bacterium]
MKAALLAIGDEIVAGLTTDTNSGFLAEQLRSVGVEPVAGFAAPDDEAAMARAFERALAEADLALSTGGLGPTADDLTTAVVARLAGRPLRLDDPSLALIEERFRGRGIPMPENNVKQALFPEGSTIVPNPIGTAPGFICPVGRGGAIRHVVCLPGVPHEMKRMAVETVLPWLEGLNPGRRFASRVFSTFGLAESRLDELLAGVVAPDEARLAFRAAFPRIQARVTVSGAPEEDLEARLDALEARVRERLGSHVYAVGDEGMEETVGKLLRERGLTLAVAESCTGGLIGDRITDVPGSSEHFLLGVVSYSNEAKERMLGVRPETLREFGAVSTQTAEEMAAGVRRISGAALGLATTGIAGPGGGTPEKPVGTVCVALAWEGGSWSRRYELGERSRDWVKGMTAQVALDRVRRWLLGEADV